MTFFKTNKIKNINSKTDHTIMTHENIVIFLEKIENERLHNDRVHPNAKQLQEQLVMNGEIRREEEEIGNTNYEVEELLSEVEIRSRLVEDLEQQILERQTLLV
jgi:hypothetical protein